MTLCLRPIDIGTFSNVISRISARIGDFIDERLTDCRLPAAAILHKEAENISKAVHIRVISNGSSLALIFD